MRTFLVALAVSMLSLSGCGARGPCDGPHVGTWVGTSKTDEVLLGADCDFRYTGAPGGCQSTGHYSKPFGDTSGTVTVTIPTVLNGAGTCLPKGVYACNFITSDTSLTFDCGAGALHYSR